MTATQQEIWQKLCEFQFDSPGARKLFETRLAVEQNWTIEYARRAIVEYRRFLLLCATAGHPCTPSEVVDEVWHMHLTFTKSYWLELCPNVLGKSLHHEPAVGLAGEDDKHRQAFQKTLNAYRTAFGEEPPRDIWLVKKPIANLKGAPSRLRWPYASVAAMALVAVGCASTSGGSDLFGFGFLLFVFGAVGIVIWAIVKTIQHWGGGPGRCQGGSCGGGCSTIVETPVVIVDGASCHQSHDSAGGDSSDSGSSDGGSGDGGSSGCGSSCGSGCGGGGD